MSIFGVGCDIVQISRIQKAVKNKGFVKRVFSKNEIKIIDTKSNKTNAYAKKFAAKEAFSKAVGIGIAKGIAFREISINNDKRGKPYINLSGKTKFVTHKTIKKKYKISLSISDVREYALAVVIISY